MGSGAATFPRYARSHLRQRPRATAPLGTVTVAKLPVRPSKLPHDDIRSIEICGFDKVPLDGSDPMAAFKYLGGQSKKTAEKWLAALLDSDDYRARAVGLFLQGKVNGDGSTQPLSEPTLDALAQLAVGSKDPAVYALALEKIHRESAAQQPQAAAPAQSLP